MGNNSHFMARHRRDNTALLDNTKLIEGEVNTCHLGQTFRGKNGWRLLTKLSSKTLCN